MKQIIEATFTGHDAPGGYLGYKPGYVYAFELTVKEGGKAFLIEPHPMLSGAYNVQCVEYDAPRFFDYWGDIKVLDKKDYDFRKYPYKKEAVKPFKLVNLVIYAKSWYGTTGDIWGDISLILREDMGTEYGSQEGAYAERNYIAGMLSKKIPIRDMNEFLTHCSEKSCWKIGYRVASHTWVNTPTQSYPAYDYWTAVLYALLAELRYVDIKDLGLKRLPEPSIPELLKKEEATEKETAA